MGRQFEVEVGKMVSKKEVLVVSEGHFLGIIVNCNKGLVRIQEF